MYKYQDLLACGENEARRATMARNAVREFMGSAEYMNGVEGEAYYSKHNATIEKYVKTLTTLSGREIPDNYSANHRLKTLIFRRLCVQQIQYVLANGLFMKNDMSNKDRLGARFDYQLQKVAKRALACGQGFGFWNYDHLEVFGLVDTKTDAGFCPLYDNDTAELMAGVRFWFERKAGSMYWHGVLYEADGYTEYSQRENDDIIIVHEKTAYKTIQAKTKAQGVIAERGENYGRLPIAPLYANDTHESELVGIRESVDCYDLIKSGFANSIDDASEIYWILKNAGGMEDIDIARFLDRVKKVHAVVVDGDEGATAEPGTINIPVEAREAMLNRLRKDIYEDFGALDLTNLASGAKTTQEIQASYQSQDDKCSDFEFELIEFCQKIFALAGIDDEPIFRWNKVVNQAEQTNTLLQCAGLLPDDVIIKHLPFLTPEEADEIINTRDSAEVMKFKAPEDSADLDE